MTTPEIRLALEANAPGSLIPTEQLRALVEAVERGAPEGWVTQTLIDKLTDTIASGRAHDATSNAIACIVISEIIAASPNPPVGGGESNGSSRDHDPDAGSALEDADIQRAARALRDEIGRQWAAHPIPGDASPESWTATGGVLDLEQCARAALSSAKQPPGDSSRPRPPTGGGEAIENEGDVGP